MENMQNQSPWVSVKDRLPSVERDLFGDATRPSMLVLTASHAGGVSVNRWNGREWLYTGHQASIMRGAVGSSPSIRAASATGTTSATTTTFVLARRLNFNLLLMLAAVSKPQAVKLN